MKLGFVTQLTEEAVELAGREGFDCLEVPADIGTVLDVNELTQEKLDYVKRIFDRNKVEIGTIFCSVNHLDGDARQREKNNHYFIKLLKSCKDFGTTIVTTNAWGDQNKTPKENVPIFKEVFSEYGRICKQEGVKIALENCPHSYGYPLSIGNIAYSPEMWDALFNAVPSESLGLEFDPSHLFWLGIDYLRALKDFGDKVIAVHAKDTEILNDNLRRYGIYGRQMDAQGYSESCWWRYRLPGWGQIDWLNFFKILYDVKFDGPILIEHEDPIFDGELRPQGLLMGKQYLKQFLLPTK